jgi:hydrogenase nickel incorporation protein HypA/HybF
MHESGLIEDLIHKIEALARQHSARKVARIEVSIGPLAAFEPEHLREHFALAATGTVAEGAELAITLREDLSAPNPHDVLLESIEIESD